MSETINDKKVFSLLEVTLSVQKTIAERYKSSFWVKAEMNKLNHYSYSGHCYPELVDKNEGKVVAQIKATLWKTDYLRINDNFLRTLKEPLKDGIKILFSATVSFDPVHGFSLRILDIDPSFSLGELEREKLETIERLKKEGIYHKNKMLKLPLLPQRIAIISVETSKGYADFLKVIEKNPWGYKFFHLLFPALLQGDKSIESIIRQLRNIKKVTSHFDLVAIIRGGGGDVGLSSYNNYELSREIAFFPLPVFTGIGHSTNETVAEMISFKNAITPTELADFLLQHFHNFSIPVQQAEEKIVNRAKRMLQEENLKFHNSLKYLISVTKNMLQYNRNEIKAHTKALAQQSGFIIRQQKEAFPAVQSVIKKASLHICKTGFQQLEQTNTGIKKQSLSLINHERTNLNSLEKSVSIMDPVNVLKRGFSITLRDGKAVKSYKDLKQGDAITTMVIDGSITSNVASTKEDEKYMSDSLNYTEAFEQLQRIVAEIEDGQISVDELSAKVKLATQLIKICKAKLTSTEEDVNTILKDLEGGED